MNVFIVALTLLAVALLINAAFGYFVNPNWVTFTGPERVIQALCGACFVAVLYGFALMERVR